MNMDSPKNESQMKREKEMAVVEAPRSDKDRQFHQQIEIFIQQQYGVFVPALVFEYRPAQQRQKEFSGWDYEDLLEFFSHFGDVELLEIYGKKSVILFKTFIDAHSTKEFLDNSNNFKESEKENFLVRWYSGEDEVYISELLRSKLKRHSPNQLVDNLNSWGTQSKDYPNYNSLNYYNTRGDNPYSNSSEYLTTNFNGQYNYYASLSLNPKAREEFSNVVNSGSPRDGSNTFNFDEEGKQNQDKFLTNGKYTCKFEIQIENDNEFQVARRLIGAKVRKRKVSNILNFF
jgi:hypothetical protein